MTGTSDGARCRKEGHALVVGNTYLSTDKRDGRVKESCRTCDLDRRPEKAVQGGIVKNLRALGWFVSTLSQLEQQGEITE